MQQKRPSVLSRKQQNRPRRRFVLNRLVPILVTCLLCASLWLNWSVLKSSNSELPSATTKVSRKTTCSPVAPRSSTQAKPLWIPAYPGSGSELLRELIPAFTGLQSSDVYEDTGLVQTKEGMTCSAPNTITCKTHWPLLDKRNPWRPARLELMSRTVLLLLRNPAKAIPSHFNFVWEAQQENASALDHTVQAPQEAWRKWRDANFKNQLKTWAWTIKRWHLDTVADSNDTEPYFRIPLYLPYEELIQESTGPGLVQDMVNVFLQEGHSLPDKAKLSSSELECLWRQVVLERPHKKRREHSYTPGYRERQKIAFLRTFRKKLYPILSDRPALLRILQAYEKDIETNLRIDDGKG